MTINFENYGKFLITFYYDDKTCGNYDGCSEGYTLKEAAEFISENIENSLSIVSADIVDAETGEIVATVEREEGDGLDEEWHSDELREYYDECGFNPYIGCYDFDC